ncbi:sugar ABC transporter substrate-binding protein [Euzebya rosea]|uniref:sugar ABC transporter substrate-binding protein n=1 Tax=Euzebya rosea TaxID=2052804 RepID=UPI000D3E8809|nr:sugar ABC transporter substrate-binding protein [Euzebya rosea]
MRQPTHRPRLLLAALMLLAVVAAACTTDPVEDTATTTDDTATSTDTAPDDTAIDDADAGADSTEEDAAAGEGEDLAIAFFASSSQNGYNQATYEGIQQAAEEAGGVTTEIFDGEFSADVQFNQIEDVVASGRFDGFVVVPNDTVGIASAIEDATSSGLAVATALFPIGPDLGTIEPQVDGIITAAAPVEPQSEELAQGVVDHCADIDPCRVVILIGQLQFPFDNVRYEAMTGVLAEHDNIEVVATGEGNYDRDQSLTVMQDLIQANPEFEVLLSNADQHVAGAMIALEEAGFDIPSLYIAGGGATQTAIEGIRSGQWDATATSFPRSEGLLAAENLIASLRGEDFEQVINMNTAGSIPAAVITAETLEEYPDFEAEWDG